MFLLSKIQQNNRCHGSCYGPWVVTNCAQLTYLDPDKVKVFSGVILKVGTPLITEVGSQVSLVPPNFTQ